MLSELGVRQVVLPTRGKPTAVRRAVEKKEAFQELVRWRTGSEGRISCLKRAFGWNRTRIDGLEGGRPGAATGCSTTTSSKLQCWRSRNDGPAEGAWVVKAETRFDPAQAWVTSPFRSHRLSQGQVTNYPRRSAFHGVSMRCL